MRFLAGRFALAGLLSTISAKIILLNETLYDGPVVPEFETKALGTFETWRFTPTLNTTTNTGWYYDTLSTTPGDSSSLFLLIEFSEELMAVRGATSPLHALVYGSFANGTAFSELLNFLQATFASFPDQSVFLSMGEQLSARSGSHLLPNVCNEVQFDSSTSLSSAALKGTMKIVSTDPPRYFCNFDGMGVSEILVTSTGWANGTPRGNASVDVSINDSPLKFTGIGYQDTLWMADGLSWDYYYWGHVSLGPYSLVFYQIQDRNSTIRHSAYISKNGKPMLKDLCTTQTLSVRPWGDNSRSPPLVGQGPPGGLQVNFSLPEGNFIANLTTNVLVLNTSVDIFSTSQVVGGFEGRKQYTGVGTYEIAQTQTG